MNFLCNIFWRELYLQDFGRNFYLAWWIEENVFNYKHSSDRHYSFTWCTGSESKTKILYSYKKRTWNSLAFTDTRLHNPSVNQSSKKLDTQQFFFSAKTRLLLNIFFLRLLHKVAFCKFKIEYKTGDFLSIYFAHSSMTLNKKFWIELIFI